MAEKIPRTWLSERSESSENLNERSAESPFSNAPGGLFTRTMRDGINYAYESSPDDEDYQPPSFLSPFSTKEEANARADFMAVTRPPMYQRSVSDGFYCESVSPDKVTYILMSPYSSENRQAASSSFINETSRDNELAEEMMAGFTGEDGNASEIPVRRVLAPNRYEEGRISDQRTSLQTQASCSQDSDDPPKSVRSSTLSNATTVSDEQRRKRVTITPFLDEYFRTRATAFVTDNPPPPDRANLVSDEAQPDNQNPQENPQEQDGVPPQEDGFMGTYYKVTNKIVNSLFMSIVYVPLAIWSFYCVFEGVDMAHCPTMDFLCITFVFLSLTSLLAYTIRVCHLLVRNTPTYQSIRNIMQYLQMFLFLGYFFIYILELASFLVLDWQGLPELCAIKFYNFLYWSTWIQMPIITLMILLHAPSACRSKWCCGKTSRS